jgi:class 3 adenylate cyclase
MGGVQQAGDYRTSLSVPILKEGLLIGVFTVGWKEVTRFSQRLVELVETFADQAAIAIDSVRLLATIQRQREEMARFLPSTVAELIASDEGDQRLAAHRTEITAVYCDLRGFTAFTETAEPEEVLEVLREYQGEMGQIVLTHGGTLEHYAGDGILLFSTTLSRFPSTPPRRSKCPSRCAISLLGSLRDGDKAASTWGSE